jgi:outer membrane lipoprotein
MPVALAINLHPPAGQGLVTGSVSGKKESDMMKRAIVIGVAGLLLGGCSTVPKELAYEPANQLVAYQPALGGMEGKPARWSGVISAVQNKADQSVIEVVYLPLKSNGVPEQTEQSPGRFLAIMQGFVDPTLYAKGRSLTVLGTIGQPVDGQIGEHKYRFSVIDATSSKLWPPVKEVEIRYMDPYFYDPFYDPFWPRRPLRR